MGENIQKLVDANARKDTNRVLTGCASEVEANAIGVFKALNSLKRDVCKI